MRNIMKHGMSKYLFTIFFLFSNSYAFANCENCQTIEGEWVTLSQVGIVVGDYHYGITNDNKKFFLADGAVYKAEKALILGTKLYVDTNTNNYSLSKK
uniref:Uncharacterized protein P8 n=1 Tax=Bacteriophage APSE-4 TaxID=568990 RepID=B6SCZ8_9VIRU|nr:conserved hypothetical protein [Bacteriophage APSE-4]